MVDCPPPPAASWRAYPLVLVPGDPEMVFPAAERHQDVATDTYYASGILEGVDSGRRYAFLTIFAKNERIFSVLSADFYVLAFFGLDAGRFATSILTKASLNSVIHPSSPGKDRVISHPPSPDAAAAILTETDMRSYRPGQAEAADPPRARLQDAEDGVCDDQGLRGDAGAPQGPGDDLQHHWRHPRPGPSRGTRLQPRRLRLGGAHAARPRAAQAPKSLSRERSLSHTITRRSNRAHLPACQECAACNTPQVSHQAVRAYTYVWVST